MRTLHCKSIPLIMYITSIHFFRLFPPAFSVTVTKLKFVSIFIRIEKTATENFRTEKISDKLQSEIYSAEIFSCRTFFRRNSEKLSEIFSAEVFPPKFFPTKFLVNNVSVSIRSSEMIIFVGFLEKEKTRWKVAKN